MAKKDYFPLAVKLDELDHHEREARRLRHELAKGVADYGRSIGLYAFSVDHFRTRLNMIREMMP